MRQTIWLCLVLGNAHQLGQAGPAPVDPALDRANLRRQRFGGFLVRQALRTHEHDGLALLAGQPGKSRVQILDREPVLLVRDRDHAGCVDPVGILDLALRPAMGGVEQVA